MRPAALNALRLLTLCAAAGGSLWAGVQAADLIETTTAEKLDDALADAGQGWASASMDGLTATLTGAAPDETARFRAMTTAGGVLPPANLRDAMSVTAEQVVAVPEYRLELLRTGADVTLHGMVPGGPIARAAVAERVGRALPGDGSVSDLLSASALPAPDDWRPAVDLGIAAAAALQDARVTVAPGRVEVHALAAGQNAARALSNRLHSEADATNVALTLNLRLPRPVVSPFLTRFRLDANGARFEACTASGPEARNRILAAGAVSGAAADPDSCIIGLGAPVPDWELAVASAIEAAGQLRSATVTVSDLSVVLVADAGTDLSQLPRITAALENDLPDLFTLTVLTPDPAQGESGEGAQRAPDPVAFSATRSPEGLIQLRGPVGERASRDMVETYARAMFNGPLHTSIRQQANLPTGWPVRILAGLEAFSHLETGRLRVMPEKIELRGTTGDPEAQTEITAALTDALGPNATLDIALRYVEALDPEAALPTAEECVARVNEILASDKITFGPGSTDLDSTALRIVARIADALRDCPDVAIEIAGHTDSQGRAEMNEALSQARADAVFNALMGREVLMSKLTSKGYGEERPVAGNDTEDGREANRRIEFALIETGLDSDDDNGGAPDAGQEAAEGAVDAEGDSPAEQATETADGTN